MASRDVILQGIELLETCGLKRPSAAGQQMDARQIAVWIGLFSDITDHDFLSGCTAAARTLTFFPAPGEIRTLALGNLENRVQAAWELVRSAIGRLGSGASFAAADVEGDEVALWCCARIGLADLGSMTSENRAIKAAEFRRLYSMAAERGYRLAYLPGEFETANRARGFRIADPALTGRPDLRPTIPVLPAPGPAGDGQ